MNGMSCYHLQFYAYDHIQKSALDNKSSIHAWAVLPMVPVIQNPDSTYFRYGSKPSKEGLAALAEKNNPNGTGYS
eukprot:4294662-Amphidinium_carterae.1